LAISSAENEQHRENLGVSNVSSNCLLSFPICSTRCEMTSADDEEEAGHFFLLFLIVLLHLLLFLLQQQQQKLF
jgi:hypothetical protein